MFGGTVKLQSTSSVTTSVSGVTVARTKSGPIMNSGFGREARKTWAWQTSDVAAAISRVMTQTARRLIVGMPSGRPRLAELAPMDLRLDVAHAVAVQLDLDLVMLHVPLIHGREPAESAGAARDHALATIDQRAASRLVELLALLGRGAAEVEHLGLCRLARRDAREHLARHDGAGFALAGRAAWSELDATLEPGADRLDEHRDQRPGDVAEDEEEGGEEQRRPRLPAREVAELHRQHLRPQALGGIDIGRDDLGLAPRLARAPLARARIDLVDLEMRGVGEVDDELRGIVREMHNSIAIREIHGKRRSRPHVVEAHRDHVALAPERVLEPRGLLLTPESREPHPELDEPAAVGQPRRPRDLDPAPRRALPEWAGLARVRDERRAPGDRLGLLALASRVDGARCERQPALVEHLEPAALHGAAHVGIGRAGH